MRSNTPLRSLLGLGCLLASSACEGSPPSPPVRAASDVAPASTAPAVVSETHVALLTADGHYVTAVNAGGVGGPEAGVAPIHTDVTGAPGPHEIFSCVPLGADRMAFQTARQTYVTAVHGGGIGGPNADPYELHTDATRQGPWEIFTLVRLSQDRCALRAPGGQWVSAVNGGGMGEASNQIPIHTDATKIGAWETFTVRPIEESPVAVVGPAPTTQSPAPPAPSVPIPPDTTFQDAEVAAGVASMPLGNSAPLPAPHVTTGSCWARFTALTPGERDASASAFRTREGHDWIVTTVDKYSARIAMAMREKRPGLVAAPLANLEVARRARDFLRRNADVLGLLESDFGRFGWRVQSGGGGSRWRVTVGYGASNTEGPPGRGRAVNIIITPDDDGEVGMIGSRIDPAVPVCTRPAISAAQAKRAPGIVGAKLVSNNVGGQPTDAGTVKASDVRDATLIVQPDEHDDTMEYRLEYEVTIGSQLGAAHWAFFVDAVTGRVLGMTPLFTS